MSSRVVAALFTAPVGYSSRCYRQNRGSRLFQRSPGSRSVSLRRPKHLVNLRFLTAAGCCSSLSAIGDGEVTRVGSDGIGETDVSECMVRPAVARFVGCDDRSTVCVNVSGLSRVGSGCGQAMMRSARAVSTKLLRAVRPLSTQDLRRADQL